MLMDPGAPASDPSLADVDLYTPAGYTVEPSMHAAWRRLRAESPVFRHARPGQPAFWCVTPYDLVNEVVKDTGHYSSTHGNVLDIADTGDSAGGVTMSLMDPPDHAQLRAPLMRMLRTFDDDAHGERVRRRLERLLQPVFGGEIVDFARLVVNLPMLAVGDIIGIPEEVWLAIPEWTMAGVAPLDPVYASGSSSRTLALAHLRLFDMFAQQVNQSRTAARTDLISGLLEVQLNGAPLADDQILVNCYSMVMGANTTTPHVATHFIWAMAEQPDAWRRVREAETAELDLCIREAVRWATPTNHVLRRATQDTEIGGQAIRAGDLMTAWVGSGNRDESRFPEPFRFDPVREPNPQLGFAVGPHYCIGAPVARLALQAMIDLIRERVATIEVVAAPRHLVSNFINGITEMPARFTMAR